jgi:hypothetical protein
VSAAGPRRTAAIRRSGRSINLAPGDDGDMTKLG